MALITVTRYTVENKRVWNDFVGNSRNGLFFFERSFMDYHCNRFEDFSLMIYEGTRLLAILPLNKDGQEVISHGGLTYGGIIVNNNMTSNKMVELFFSLATFLNENNIHTLTYKVIPYIYHEAPTQEDLYVLSILGGKLSRRDLSSVIDFSTNVKMSKGRKYQIGQARKSGVSVNSEESYSEYWSLLTDVVSKHNAVPTHSLSEIETLANSFPKKIKLYVAKVSSVIVAGVVLFDNGNVIHTQYMASSDAGREIGALDLILSDIIDEYKSNRKFFSFGISTENSGKFLNTGLVRQKESFGARGVVHDHYSLNINDVVNAQRESHDN